MPTVDTCLTLPALPTTTGHRARTGRAHGAPFDDSLYTTPLGAFLCAHLQRLHAARLVCHEE